MNSYPEALKYLYSRLPMFSRTGAPAYKPGLDTVLDLASFFDNPHQKFKSIHVGGTNGKGSTSHMISSVLQSQGYKVGLYTSPHLVDFRERIKINGRMIPENNVVEFVEAWKKSGYNGSPSFFELTMIMAFDWFAKEKVDYAVIEVGMGGRLDSTNIIQPLLSIITNISHDHNQFLGNTLKEIAGEKAGIIKQGIPVVIGETQEETKNVFLETANKNDCEIFFADQYDDNLELISLDAGWEGRNRDLKFILPLGGDYQKHNVKTVLVAIDRLRKIGIDISDSSIKSGLENVINQTGLMGRWSVLSFSPLTIADTGHNIAGLTYNFNQLNKLIKSRRDGKLRVVIGFVADKAIDKIIKILPQDAVYYVTNAQIPRALPANQLKKIFDDNGLKAFKFDLVAEAYKEAKKEASEKDIIFIGGSTFIVADYFSSI